MEGLSQRGNMVLDFVSKSMNIFVFVCVYRVLLHV